MAHPLADFRLKLNRANMHLDALKREIDAWFEKQPYGVTGKYDPGPPEKYVLYLRFFEEVPRECGLLVGDFAHNARSALDYLAWQLVQANSNAPDRRTQFPIVLSPWEWPGRNGKRRLRGASDRHIAMVERLQPYNRLDADGFSWARLTFKHPLSRLNVLSNEDKHRVLVATPAVLQSIGWNVVGSRDVAPLPNSGTANVGSALMDGSPVIEIPVTATGPNPEVEVEVAEGVRIAVLYGVEFDKWTWRQMIDLLENLDGIATELRRIFQIFAREFV